MRIGRIRGLCSFFAAPKPFLARIPENHKKLHALSKVLSRPSTRTLRTSITRKRRPAADAQHKEGTFMEKRTFADRYKVNCCPSIMAEFTNEQSPWSEDEAMIAAGLAWGREKDRLLKWVRLRMERLTEKQRRCIELRYFEGLTYIEVAKLVECSPSAACRSAQRGVEKLRRAARRDRVGYR